MFTFNYFMSANCLGGARTDPSASVYITPTSSQNINTKYLVICVVPQCWLLPFNLVYYFGNQMKSVPSARRGGPRAPTDTFQLVSISTKINLLVYYLYKRRYVLYSAGYIITLYTYIVISAPSTRTDVTPWVPVPVHTTRQWAGERIL